jgi:hypothetical protein
MGKQPWLVPIIGLRMAGIKHDGEQVGVHVPVTLAVVIRNPHIQRAYAQPVGAVLAWRQPPSHGHRCRCRMGRRGPRRALAHPAPHREATPGARCAIISLGMLRDARAC